MNDLISRSALLKEFEIQNKVYRPNELWHWTGIKAFIENAPTVEPVIRCKNCEHWGAWEVPEATDRVKVCECAGYLVGENGYCCYADMRGENNGRT